MRKIVADLHVHTNHSDGIHSPSEIVDFALQTHLTTLAITDHDNFDGIAPSIKAAQGRIEIIPGIELSCEIDKKDVHVLGYFIDHTNSKFKDEVEQFRIARDTRAEKIVENLRKANMEIDFSLIKKNSINSSSIGRPHIARAMLEKGYVSSIEEAFKNYLHDGSPYYVPKYKIHPHQAFSLIRNAGGVPIWAHPGTVDCDDYLEDFIDKGLMGLEVFHPKHAHHRDDHYYTLAKRYDLVISGGSDFHGKDMGPDMGSCGLTKKDLELFIESKPASIEIKS